MHLTKSISFINSKLFQSKTTIMQNPPFPSFSRTYPRFIQVLAILFFSFTSSMLYSQQSVLLPVNLGDKYGFIDTTGKIAIEVRFEGAMAFSEGMAAVKINGKWGFIDATGKVIIEPQYYYSPESFSEGIAVVMAQEAVFGAIDKTGKYAVEPKYGELIFSEGVSPAQIVTELNQKWGYIDINGKEVIKPQFAGAAAFSQGLAAVKIDSLWGYIDKTGKMIIAPQFQNAGLFSDDRALVQTGKEFNYKWGFIDQTGKLVIKAEYNWGSLGFSEGRAYVITDKHVFFIDKTGTQTGKKEYDDTWSFKNGRAAIKLKNNWGFIDLSGNLVIKPEFASVDNFYQGFAKAQSKKKTVYINRAGKVIWTEK